MLTSGEGGRTPPAFLLQKQPSVEARTCDGQSLAVVTGWEEDGQERGLINFITEQEMGW